MTEEEISNLYIRIAFHYESTIDRLVGKGLLDQDFVDNHRKTFYDSLNEEKLQASQKIRIQRAFYTSSGTDSFTAGPAV